MDAAQPGKFRFRLSRAGVGKKLLDVMVAKHQHGAVTSLDERKLAPVALKSPVRPSDDQRPMAPILSVRPGRVAVAQVDVLWRRTLGKNFG